jgi:hypothetical protein
MRSPWPRCATISPDRQGKSKRNSARRDQAARRRVGRLCYVCQRSSVASQAPLGAGGATTSVQCGRRAPCAARPVAKCAMASGGRQGAVTGPRSSIPSGLAKALFAELRSVFAMAAAVHSAPRLSLTEATKLSVGRWSRECACRHCGMEKPPALLPGASSDPLGSGNSEAQYRKLRWIRK